jgi:hypothetical protein
MMGKGVAKGCSELLNLDGIIHKGTGYNGGNFKDFRTAWGGVKPQK